MHLACTLLAQHLACMRLVRHSLACNLRALHSSQHSPRQEANNRRQLQVVLRQRESALLTSQHCLLPWPLL